MNRGALYLRHILEAIQKIEVYTAAGREIILQIVE
jgi:uncharacterized protein with HEPN domain